MGMFDSIKCFHKLPLPEDLQELKDFNFQETVYQTKDLDNSLDYFEIRADGTLWTEKHEREWVDDKDSILGGYFESKKKWWEQLNYSGAINFYEHISSAKYKNFYWIEFRALFDNGKLLKIELFKFTSDDDTENKKRAKEWQEKWKKDSEFRQKKVMKYLYIPLYERPIRFIFRKLSWLRHDLTNFLNKIPLHKIEDWFLRY